MIPDNAVWYHASYIIAAAIYVLYALSVQARRKKVKKVRTQVVS